MKKGFKLTAASVMAVSALAPTAVFANETAAEASTGFYTSNSFYTPVQYKELSLEEKRELLAREDLVFVVGGLTYFAKDAIGKSDAQLAEIAIPVAEFEEQYGELTESGIVAPTPGDKIVVESVSAINNNAVTVTFDAITDAIEEANVVVKDGEGNVVPTKAMLIAEGTTSADFEFVTALEDADKVGVWTVNGLEYSFDAINQLADIAAAVTTPNEIKLQAALDAAGITYADETRIAAYLGALQVEGATASLEAVQKAITKIDEEAAKDEANEAAVEAVLEAKTQAQLLKALQANFEVVNPEWIVEYQAALADPAPVTVEDIQDAVTGVNAMKVEPAVSAANMSLDSEKVAEARALVTKWIPADKEDEEPTKALVLDGLNLEDALIAVNNAKTNSALKSALTNLDTLENSLLEKYKDVAGFDKIDDFDIETVEDANLTAYRDAIKEAEVGAKNQRKDIQKIVTDANNAAVDAAKVKVLADLNAVDNKTAAADVVALLEKSQELNDQANKVNVAYAEAYKTAVVEKEAAGEPAVKFADAEAVNTLVGEVNTAQDAAAQLAAVNTASTASEMSKALITLEAANDKTDFTNLSSTAKLEVAEIVLAKRNAETDKKFANNTAALAAVTAGEVGSETGAIAERTAFLEAVNTASNIAGMKTVLADETSLLPEFAELGAVEQTEKAEAVLNKLTELKAQDPSSEFNTIAEIKAAAGL